MDRAIAGLAGGQHGVVALHQLLAIGLSPRAVRNRVAAGKLHRVHRGAYAVGHSLLSREGLWMAAVLASGPGAALSHRSAGGRRGLRPDNRPVTDVITPRAGLRPVRGIVRHTSRTLEERDITVVDAIPCTSVARTLLDLAATIDRQGLRRACNRAEVLRVFDLRDMDDVLARNNGHRGAWVLREVADRGRIGEAITRNDMEEEFLDLCESAGLARPRVNHWIPLEDRGVEADFLWPERRLIAETDGRETHETPTALYDDRRRDQRLLAVGYRVVRFTWWQVFHAPEEILDTLRPLMT